MNDKLLVQYVGCQVKSLVREYTFVVRTEGVPREFTLTIAHEAFSARRARFQDGPDICSIRLRRELAAGIGVDGSTHFPVTESDLAQYGQSHSPKSSSLPHKPGSQDE